MKRLIIYILFIILIDSCSSEQGVSIDKIKVEALEDKNYFFYNSKKYSGRIYGKDNKMLTLEFNVLNGLYHGLYQEFYENGFIKKEINYNKGVLQGYERTFFKNGKLSESINYNDGNFHGVRNVYWENGMLKETNSFSNGILVGKSNYFFPNGKLRKKIEFDSNGKKNGVWEEYDSKGKLIEEIVFENGIKK